MTDAKRFQQLWDDGAASYDAKIAFVEERFLAQSRRWVAKRVAGEVLEVAIGTGLMLPYYPPTIDLAAVEWSPAMVAIARRRAATLGLDVDLRVGDAMRLPFGDHSFDTLVSTFAMCCVPDEVAALREAARVLRPGGSLLLADHVVSAVGPLRLVQRVLDHVTVRSQGEHWTRRPLPLLDELGFDVVESRRRTWGMIEELRAVRRP